MVFGIVATNGSLRDEVFCLTEERNFFRTKLLESVSEMTALQKELQAQKREVHRLRQELLKQSTKSSNCSHANTRSVFSDNEKTNTMNNNNKVETEESTMSSTTAVSDSLPTHDSDDYDDTDADSAKDIRQSAEKLLQWASYRSSVRQPRSTDSGDEEHHHRHPIQLITLLGDDNDEDKDGEEDDEAEGEEQDGLTVEGDEEDEADWGA